MQRSMSSNDAQRQQGTPVMRPHLFSLGRPSSTGGELPSQRCSAIGIGALARKPWRGLTALLALALGLVACGDGKADSSKSGSRAMCEIPTNFTWTASTALIAPASDAEHDLVAIKDPTVVRFEDRWHLFATTANTDQEWSLVYLNFEDWKDAASAEQYYMDQTPGFEGYLAAPHVFYFTPQKRWYLVYQTQPPKYSTTDDISDPSSFTQPKPLFTGKPRSAPDLWIDYWVICDDDNCYLFFTGDDGALYRSRTSREDFPDGMDEPVIAMRMAKNDLFEGSATYKIKGADGYVTLVEAIGPSGVRYYKAWTADALDGAWTPIANSFDRPFAGERNVSFTGDAWTRDISHGELLRDGYDERMEVDLCGGKLQMLFQGEDFAAGEAASDYSQRPYRLGLLTQGPSDPDIERLELPPTPADPFPSQAMGDNLLTNPGFEDGTEGWMVWGGRISTVDAPVHGGEHAALISDRSESWNAGVQDIFNKVQPGQSYFASAWVTVGMQDAPSGVVGAGGAGGSGSSGNAGAAGQVPSRAGAGGGQDSSAGAGGAGGTSSGGGAAGSSGASAGAEATQPVTLTMKAVCGEDEIYSTVASGEVRAGDWMELSGTLDAPDCDDLVELVIYAEGPAPGIDLYIDDAMLSL